MECFKYILPFKKERKLMNWDFTKGKSKTILITFYPRRLLHNACAVGYILKAFVFHCGLQYNRVGWSETSSTLQKK